jgi:hypothetical protein
VGLHGLVFCLCYSCRIFVPPAYFLDFQELFFCQTGEQGEYGVVLPFVFVFFQFFFASGIILLSFHIPFHSGSTDEDREVIPAKKKIKGCS